ncbi:carbonic anhydrase family protein [Lentilactobacillus otakiensis]|uniref:carbonic anhydrase n=1 Tax=Lentilactobacillus otakiensis DSM 19908 = JCM 15040 TaxID=1423780 RepID=S4NC91_9LACO|nr:carbonic anhydrase family protein [Lentilactobacillus otakiensis]KRL10175.1 carbonic anhydrase [Lentilactobacillus otakiensis DSM 19908 = JCM 15040]MBZ3777279.1 carbonic anhydrase family protein [Lentilactobacillus otakiensis]MDV3518537.1 carbonic anhydrase family protein [Lentilactobacillus otakiensis]GAD16409.1 carbonic anhydrase [Lentilactobacillus otakiensis DSM 19908 = JCM 15040]
MLDYNQQDKWPNGFGELQSPIKIDTSKLSAKRGQLNYHVLEDYRLKQEIDDGTTIRLTGSGSAEIFGRNFEFQQAHFHSPSEHVINGRRCPLEIHMVHKNVIGQLCVVALLVEHGETPNAPFQKIIDNYEKGETEPVDLNIKDWAPWYPVGFHYLGSLTTPPLTEGVEWLLVSNPDFTVSDDQVEWFRKHFGKDDRKLQPLNGRSIEFYK